mmetsp:Transcript_86624/g.245628  ORF Transcript_86624/g.245628 Transcript_86624/m.245628 type:complete len:256 (-) Transcript_86624:88-855(-)
MRLLSTCVLRRWNRALVRKSSYGESLTGRVGSGGSCSCSARRSTRSCLCSRAASQNEWSVGMMQASDKAQQARERGSRQRAFRQSMPRRTFTPAAPPKAEASASVAAAPNAPCTVVPCSRQRASRCLVASGGRTRHSQRCSRSAQGTDRSGFTSSCGLGTTTSLVASWGLALGQGTSSSNIGASSRLPVPGGLGSLPSSRSSRSSSTTITPLPSVKAWWYVMSKFGPQTASRHPQTLGFNGLISSALRTVSAEPW